MIENPSTLQTRKSNVSKLKIVDKIVNENCMRALVHDDMNSDINFRIAHTHWAFDGDETKRKSLLFEQTLMRRCSHASQLCGRTCRAERGFEFEKCISPI